MLLKIDCYCKTYPNDPKPFRNKFEIGDVEFCNSMEKIYLKIQKYLNEERDNFPFFHLNNLNLPILTYSVMYYSKKYDTF